MADKVLRHIESFSVTLSSLSTTVTLSTTLLDLSKSFLVFGVEDDNNEPGYGFVGGEITNTTTLTFARATSGGNNIVIRGYVVEFLSGVYVQRGKVSNPASGSGDVTLSNIDLSKSFRFVSYNHEGTSYGEEDYITTRLWDDTGTKKLRWQTEGDPYGGDLFWQVIEYDNCSVQRGDASIGFLAATTTESITSVSLTKSFVNCDYRTAWSGNLPNSCVKGSFNSSTQIAFERGNAPFSVTVVDIEWEVVTFTDDTTVEEEPEGFNTGDGDEDGTIIAVDGIDTAIAFTSTRMKEGLTEYGGDDNLGVCQFTGVLTTTTNLKMRRGNTADRSEVIFYVVDFKTPAVGTIAYGHLTSVDEENIRTFTGNVTTDGVISGSGNAEKVRIGPGKYLETNPWYVGVGNFCIDFNKYLGPAESFTIKYKTGATIVACEADTWSTLTSPYSFTSSGFVKVRVEA